MIPGLEKVPQWLIVVVSLSLGVAGIFYFRPPPSICDPQIIQFKRTFQGDLFPRSLQGNTIPANFRKYLDDCRYGNSSGSCFKYFDLLKRVSAFIHRSPPECTSEIAEDLASIRGMLENGIKLMANFAWGAGPGVNPTEKVGWLKEYEVAVFCEMKRSYQTLYGDENWFQLRWSLLQQLPNVENGLPIQFTTEDQKFDRSLFSVNCNYL